MLSGCPYFRLRFGVTTKRRVRRGERLLADEHQVKHLDCSPPRGFTMRQSTYARNGLLTLAVFLASSMLGDGIVNAQPPQRTRGSQDGRFQGRSPELLFRSLPVLVALDSNSDGVISKSEIENATKSLQTLDKNKDGQLTSDEMRPDFSAIRSRGGEPGGARNSDAGSTRAGASAQGRENEIVERFMKLDEDKDGKLSSNEVPERMRGFFARADQNGDGFATREELIAAASRANRMSGNNAPLIQREGGQPGQQRDSGQFFARMFEQRDADKDGKLSAEEMPEQMAERLQQIDADADGFVSRKEMEAMVSRFGSRGVGQRNRGGGKSGYGAGDSSGGRPSGEVPRRPDAE